tara:strand:+ start:3262 stop:4620 length:1359 start_codon:yes stop_codon:yes gene_type:complete
MTRRRKSMVQSLLGSLLLPGLAVMVIGVLIVHHIFKEEYDELLDASLVGRAHLLLEFIETTQGSTGFDVGSLLDFENQLRKPDERSVMWALDEKGEVYAQSKTVGRFPLPAPLIPGLSTSDGHRLIVLRSDQPETGSVVVAEPMIERNEAITDVVIGVVAGFIMLGMLFGLSSFWAVRRSVAMIAELSRTIAEKNEHNLSPIDRENVFSEITPAIDTLDGLMARLDRAMTAERAFATNAAHELRTPVAICQAQAQRLRAKLSAPDQIENIVEIETGLKRLERLIERLLQLSRAQSGLGLTAVATDINPVIKLLMTEMRSRSAQPDKVQLKFPEGRCLTRVDPDALGIILNNIFDNALKHARGPSQTIIDASQPGHVVVFNDCDPLSSTDLDRIKQRFIRRGALSDGYGLGLSIVQDLCAQSGCSLEIYVPSKNSPRGFAADLSLPKGKNSQA